MQTKVRKIDQIGRIVLPKEFRDSYDLVKEGDEVELIEVEGGLLLKKHTPKCTFCGSEDELIEHMGKAVCRVCLAEINQK